MQELGILLFKIRWKGFSEEYDTWEPEENLAGCKELVEQFWKKKKQVSDHSYILYSDTALFGAVTRI